MTKKAVFVLVSVITALMYPGCEMTGPDPIIPPPPPPDDAFLCNWDADDIAAWTTMVTPGNDAKGTATKSPSGYAVIQATAAGWGGVQSPEFDLEYGKAPVFYIKIQGLSYKWGVRFVPSTKAAGDNGWGFSLLGDDDDNTPAAYTYSQMGKMNTSAANEGKHFTTLYPGATVKGRLWVYAIDAAAGGTVNVESIKIYYPEAQS